jgi:cell division protein FtsQ
MAHSHAGRSTLQRPSARAYGGRSAAGSRRIRTPSALLGLAHGLRSLLSRRARLRVALLACLIALPLLAGGWLWLRQSSFVSVQRVQVIGARGPQAAAIEAALAGAARHMSTLDVSVGALRASVAPFAVVRDLRVTPAFPHRLRIQVIEQQPVAALVLAGTRTAVAADGVVLGPTLLSGSLPTLAAASLPAAGARVSEPGMLGALTVLGAAPGPLRKAVLRVYSGPDGLTVAMRNGLLAYFGDATRPHAKWLSLDRVLADPSSTGASYVDVRLPERPAAGFPSGSPPSATGAAATGTSATGTPSSEVTAASEATVAALAARLSAANGGEASASGREAASPTPPGTSSSSTTTETAPPASAETPSGPAGESPSGGATPGG